MHRKSYIAETVSYLDPNIDFHHRHFAHHNLWSDPDISHPKTYQNIQKHIKHIKDYWQFLQFDPQKRSSNSNRALSSSKKVAPPSLGKEIEACDVTAGISTIKPGASIAKIWRSTIAGLWTMFN